MHIDTFASEHMGDALLDCGHPPSEHSPYTTGYGQKADGSKHCYACCAKETRADMIEDGATTLYLTHRQRPGSDRVHWYVTDWAAHLEFPVTHCKEAKRGGGFGSQRTDAWFDGPDGYVWHAINRGDMQIARCRRTRVKVKT